MNIDFDRLRSRRGIGLIEVLLVIALMLLSAGVGIPAFSSLQRQNDADLASETIVQTLRRAQLNAGSVLNDSPWGVYIGQGTITLFEGSSYAARVPSSDEVFEIPTTVSLSGLNEVVFAGIMVKTTNTGAIVINSPGSASRTIEINEFGMLEF
jgi:Tfp pilus assembly protein FimT